jgi:hypothetical protein
MLKDTINNSISSKSRHFREEQIVDLFYKEGKLDPVEHYAVSVIFGEAALQEILLFLRKHHIPFYNARALYRNLAHSRRLLRTKGRRDKYEWFLG